MRKLVPKFNEADFNLSQDSVYWCQICQSNQIYNAKAKSTGWDFIVQGGKYKIYFWPTVPRCAIYSMQGQDVDKWLISLKFIPFNLTPKNTTEEKIKMIILFS
jgi:hypothetical protein